MGDGSRMCGKRGDRLRRGSVEGLCRRFVSLKGVGRGRGWERSTHRESPSGRQVGEMLRARFTFASHSIMVYV